MTMTLRSLVLKGWSFCLGMVLGMGMGIVMLTGAEGPASQPSAVHFSRVEVWVDTGKTPLAAYQVLVWASKGAARVVGVEGGEGLFQEPPHYDPKALQKDRVVLGAYRLEDTTRLPRGRVRVATIHFQFTGAVQPEFKAVLQVAASPAGESLAATVFLTPPTLP